MSPGAANLDYRKFISQACFDHIQVTIVFAALAISRIIEYQTGISIKQFVKLLRPIRSGIVIFNGIEIPAQPEIPEDVNSILDKLFSGN